MRFRLLWPLLLVTACAVLLVATLSAIFGRQWALRDVRERFAAVEQTLQRASFPLTSSVVDSLAKLSGAELIVVGETGDLVASTLQIDASTLSVLREQVLAKLHLNTNARDFAKLSTSERSYLALGFQRRAKGNFVARTRLVCVLFDESRVIAAGRRAGLLPLATGLSTIILVSTLMSILTGRLAGRLAKLQRGVERVADGDFDLCVADDSTDEVGQLGQSFDKMTTQLEQLWTQVNRQQSQKLIHQIAGGMAHQLRNTLTGARLALELHRQSCKHHDQQDLEVSLHEMRSAEDYVRRMLLVGSGEHEEHQPASVARRLDDVHLSHAAIARHLRVELDWNVDHNLLGWSVADGATFSAAISNLLLNALQAAKRVSVTAKLLEADTCSVSVSDDGAGIDPSVAEQLFEPFVTTKPEGMGLGLPLVRRAADKLSGDVEWSRHDGLTTFTFLCKVTQCQM